MLDFIHNPSAVSAGRSGNWRTAVGKAQIPRVRLTAILWCALGAVHRVGYAASETAPLKGIMDYETRPLVSIDFKGNPASATIDALSTMVVNKRMVKIYAWYDNEWGYSNRMAELARKVGNSL